MYMIQINNIKLNITILCAKNLLLCEIPATAFENSIDT